MKRTVLKRKRPIERKYERHALKRQSSLQRKAPLRSRSRTKKYRRRPRDLDFMAFVNRPYDWDENGALNVLDFMGLLNGCGGE